jgi:hypothetical protein
MDDNLEIRLLKHRTEELQKEIQILKVAVEELKARPIFDEEYFIRLGLNANSILGIPIDETIEPKGYLQLDTKRMKWFIRKNPITEGQ